MKAVRIHKYGHSNELILDNIPIPVAGDNELLVEVHAVGVNPMDWKIREGVFKDMMPVEFPITVGQDFAGTVIQTGKNVHGFEKGDPVYGFAPGAYAEYVCVGEGTIAKIPEDIDYLTAAAIPTAGLTAYQLIMNAIELKAGQSVLIHGAGGGVGSFAVQLALWKKALVFANGSNADIDFLQKLGVKEVINFEKEKFEDRINGVDAVIDLVGGDTLKRSYGLVKKGGVIATTVGQVDEKLLQERGIRGINFYVKQNSEDLAHLARLVEQEIIRPRIFEVLTLDEARRAQDDLQLHFSKGKVVLEVRPV